MTVLSKITHLVPFVLAVGSLCAVSVICTEATTAARLEPANTPVPYYTSYEWPQKEKKLHVHTIMPNTPEQTATLAYIMPEVQSETPSNLPLKTEEMPEQPETPEYIWPLDGVITSEFGYRDIEVGSSDHHGIDIGADEGTEIRAAKAGVVSYSDYNDGGYGYLVTIEHEDSETYYAHCSELLVDVGEEVQQGQVIALVGSTGISTGPHCHFEVRYDGQAYDPMSFLPAN